MDTKQDHYVCCLQETHLKPMDTYRLKVNRWKKLFHADGDQKKTGLAILISYNIDLEIKTVKWDNEGHYIMIKDHKNEKKIIKIREDITIINIYTPNIVTSEVIQSCPSRVSLWSHGLYPTMLLCPWDFPGKSNGVGCHFLLQRIFLTQGSNPGLLHCRQMLYRLSHQGSCCQLSTVRQTAYACGREEEGWGIYIVSNM